jgi:RES domain-containing protein
VCRNAFHRLDGEGARFYGGRWNSEGVAVVYLSSSFPLAMLEYLVHVDASLAPTDLVSMEVDVPDATSTERIELKDLPRGWNAGPHPWCVERGDAWIRANRSCLLFVPSAVAPKDFNVLLNPAHPEAMRITVLADPLVVDPRLLGP